MYKLNAGALLDRRLPVIAKIKIFASPESPLKNGRF
jgi:hypothetical protein